MRTEIGGSVDKNSSVAKNQTKYDYMAEVAEESLRGDEAKASRGSLNEHLYIEEEHDDAKMTYEQAI